MRHSKFSAIVVMRDSFRLTHAQLHVIIVVLFIAVIILIVKILVVLVIVIITEH